MTEALRILHLEDNPNDAELIRAMLDSEGTNWAIARVDTRGDFIAALERDAIDLILADYSLPSFDGLSALKIAREKTPGIPFIFVSGTLGEEVAIEAVKTGATDYVLKHNLKRLSVSVRHALHEASERRQRAEAEEKFRQIAENIREVFWVTDLANSRMIYISPAYEEVWGRTRESLYRSPRSWLDAIHPDDRELVALAAQARESIGAYDETYRIVRPDGAIRWIRDRAFPVKDPSGNVYRIVGVAEDITARKEAEEQTRKNLERIRALHEIDLAITSSLDLHDLLETLLEKIDLFVPITAVSTVNLVNAQTGVLEPVVCRGMNAEIWRAQAGKTPASWAKRAVESAVPVALLDIQTIPKNSNPEIYRALGLSSYLGVPLVAGGKILGALGLYTKEKHEFADEEIEFLKTLASQAAIAIHNAQLYESTKRQQIELVERERIQRILKELSQDITRMDVDTLLEKLTNTIREGFQVDVADVRFLGKTRWQKVLISSEAGVEWPPGGGEFGKGATLWVAKHRRSLAIRDYTEQEEFAPGRVMKKFGLRGFLAAPLLLKSGDVIGIIRALSRRPRDFTTQEIDLFEQLAHGAAIAIENEQLYTDLQKSDRAKSEFLGVMSHELRTPINVIMGYANLIKDDLVGEADARHRQSLQIIEHHANSLLGIINTIMDATRIESGNVTLDRREVYVDHVFEQLKSTCDLFREKDIALLWKLPERLPSLMTDHEKLRRILHNLIHNAIKFTDAGSVTISAHLVSHEAKEEDVARISYLVSREDEVQNHEHQVSNITSEPPDPKRDTWNMTPDTNNRDTPTEESAIRKRDANNEIRDTRFIEFSVQDTGVGIAAANLPYIFEMFRQADSSTTRAYEGVGLGLYVVKKYCDLLGASIRVESTVGKGSTFTVTIPCVAAGVETDHGK